MDMVQNARIPSDLNYVYDLTLTLIQVKLLFSTYYIL